MPLLARSGGGAIVNVSSIGGRSASLVTGVPYAAAKAGVLGLTRRLALELGPLGIRVNAIAPGLFLSGPRLEGMWEALSEAERKRVLDEIPLGRMPGPGEAAAPILFLAQRGRELHHRGGARRERRALHERLSEGRRSSVDLHDERGAGVSCGAAGEQPDAAAAPAKGVDELDDPAQPGRRLGMAVDEARAVWIDRLASTPSSRASQMSLTANGLCVLTRRARRRRRAPRHGGRPSQPAPAPSASCRARRGRSRWRGGARAGRRRPACAPAPAW